MAGRQNPSAAMTELVAERFKSAPAGSSLRRRLLAAAVDAPIYPTLKQIEAEQEVEARAAAMRQQGIFEFTPKILQFNNYGNIDMSPGNTFNVGRDLNAQNVVGGDMIASANAAVQRLSADRKNDREILEAVMAFVNGASIGSEMKAEIGRTVELAANDPTPENKNSVMKALKSAGSAIGTVGAAAGGYAEIINLVSGWIG
jgi:hypothetical protein